jgi:uncharacterized protein YqjF (DUF2071 family)
LISSTFKPKVNKCDGITYVSLQDFEFENLRLRLNVRI